MAVLIEQPLILAEAQNKKFQSVTISRDRDGGLVAVVIFDILCPNSGNKLKEEVLTYTGEEYNTFWANFNTGTYLYQELTKDLEDFELPEDLENDFLNEE